MRVTLLQVRILLRALRWIVAVVAPWWPNGRGGGLKNRSRVGSTPTRGMCDETGDVL
jgi:hypothetical protein